MSPGSGWEWNEESPGITERGALGRKHQVLKALTRFLPQVAGEQTITGSQRGYLAVTATQATQGARDSTNEKEVGSTNGANAVWKSEDEPRG